MTTLKVGIASYEEMKARTMAVARGEHRIAPGSRRCGSPRRSPLPRFCRRAIATCCGIVEQAPGSLDELARITGKAKSNLSRTLRTMEGYGLVRLNGASGAGSRPRSCTTGWNWTCRSLSRGRQVEP